MRVSLHGERLGGSQTHGCRQPALEHERGCCADEVQRGRRGPEHERPVLPFSIPESSRQLTQLRANPALALFEERARAKAAA